jgi:hypothetical protein
MWNPRPLIIFIIAFFLGAIVLAAAMYPALGLASMYFLLLSLIGPFVSAIYSFVGKKVQKLKDTFSGSKGELAECLMVNGLIQSPGIAVLGDNDLTLAPIVGERVTFKLTDIISYRQVSFFNGKLLLGKKGFYLDIGIEKRIGFAVAAGTGKRWALRLRQAGIRSVR